MRFWILCFSWVGGDDRRGFTTCDAKSRQKTNACQAVQHTTYDAFLALAGASFITVISALSVSTYDWSIITGIAILSVDIPFLAGFARWIPPDFRSDSTWHDHFANIAFVLAMPLAIIGNSLVLIHVHVICGGYSLSRPPLPRFSTSAALMRWLGNSSRPTSNGALGVRASAAPPPARA